MSGREPTNAQVLEAFMRVVADERESMRRELQKARDEQFQQWQLKLAAQMQLRRSELAEENSKLAEENRALCAELHEAKTMLNFFKTQRDPDQPPQ